MLPRLSTDSPPSGYDSSPCPSSPDYNDSPPYKQPSLKPAQRLLPFKGWLSMAPQIDEPSPPPVQQHQPESTQPNQSPYSSSSPTTSTSTNSSQNHSKQQPKKLTAYSYKPPTPRKAVFSVGTDDEDGMESPAIGKNNTIGNQSRNGGGFVGNGTMTGSVSSVVQVSYPGDSHPPTSLAALSAHAEAVVDGDQRRIVPLNQHSRYSDDSDGSPIYDESPPEFDVRASFAPMPKFGVGVGLTVQPIEPKEDQVIPGLHSSSPSTQRESKKARSASSFSYEVGPGGFIKINGGGGLTHGKRQYKGITAHAVEQEMEESGDETVMSHAPDPVYLASRLEGLRRNLEEEDKAPGGRKGGWIEWADDSQPEESQQDVEMKDDLPSSSIQIKVDDEDLDDVQRKHRAEEEKEEERRLKKLPASPAPTAASNPFLGGAGGSEISSVLPYSIRQKSSMMPIMERSFTSESIASIVPPAPSKEAKMKALDERLEIRNIKRADLEQVRELHCFHGDGDKHDLETYTTSAPFLLRLLVDEKHVCLVAVERPLPEPFAFPNREELSQSIAPVSQKAEGEVSPMAIDSSPESLPERAEGEEKLESRAKLISGSQNLKSSSANFNSQPSSGTTSANSFSEDPSTSTDADSRFSFLRSNGHTKGIGHFNPRSNRHQPPHSGLSGVGGLGVGMSLGAAARSEMTAPTSIGCGSTEDLYGSGAPTTKSVATVRDPREIQMNLFGPTHDDDVAPPRTIKVMGLPPRDGLRATSQAETVLAVATATVGIKENNEDMFADHNSVHVKEWEAHILTLSIAPEERSQGLGKKMLECLIRECKRRASDASSRSSSSSRSGGRAATAATASGTPRPPSSSPPPPKMRTYLEVHPSNSKAIHLYEGVGFQHMRGNEGVKKNFFRGDGRIPMRDRMKIGGQDAIVMELLE